MKINPITLYSVKNTENTKKQQSKVSNPAFGMADLSQNKEEFEFFKKYLTPDTNFWSLTKNYKKLEKIHQEYQHNPLLIASLYLERVPKDDVQWANNGTSTDLVRDTMNKKIKELVADTKEISDELSLEILRTQKPILDKTNLEYLYYFEKKVKIKQLLKGII